MKIILATPLFPPEIESLSTYAKELAWHLKDEHQISVVAYASQAEDVPGINIIKVNKHHPLGTRLFNFTKTLSKASKSADVIYAQNAVAAGLPAIFVGQRRNIPVVINFAEDEAWKRSLQLGLSQQSLEEFLENPAKNRKTRYIFRVQGWVLRRAARVVVSSQSLGDLLVKFYQVPQEKIIVSYNPIVSKQKLSFEAEKKDKQIFTSGRLFEWSGIDKLIQSMGKLPDYQLFIAGDGPDRSRLEKLSQRLKLSERIKFLGQISKAENWHLKKTSACYFANFTGNDFSLETLGAYLAQVPIVAWDCKISRELLDKQSIAKDSDDLIVKLGSLPVGYAIDFSWQSHLDKLEKTFEEINRK